MLLETYLKTSKCLSFSQKIKFLTITFLNWFVQILELIGIAAFLPVLTIFLNSKSELLIDLERFIPDNIQESLNINFFLLIILIIFLTKNIIFLSSNYLSLNFEKKIILELSRNIIFYYSFYPSQKFFSFTQGEVMRNTITEIKNFYKLCTAFFSIFVDVLFILSVIFFLILYKNFNELIIIIINIFLVFLFSKFTRKKINSYGVLQSNFSRILIEKLVSIFNLFKELKLYKKSKKYNNDFLNILSQIKDIDIFKNILNILPKILFELLFIFFIVLFIYLNYDKGSNVELFEKLFILTISIFRLLPSFLRIQNNINSIYLNKRPLENIYYELINSKNKKFDEKNSSNEEIKNLELKKINFGYKNKKIIKNFSFKATRGDKISIRGRSGSGKTTLVNILSGLIKPKSGKIFVNNREISSKENFNKFTNIGFLSQDLFLEDATIKDNITLNEKKIDKKKYKKAILFSEIDKFINKLKDKDNTKLISNGETISGGQRQRIVLARTFYHAKDILILDECTSNLDNKTENKILNNLNIFCKDKIVFFISHRNIGKKIFNKYINF